MDRPLTVGENYNEEETIHALAVCAAGMAISHHQGDMKDLEEGIRMSWALVINAKIKWGEDWARRALFEPGLLTALQRYAEGKEDDDDGHS